MKKLFIASLAAVLTLPVLADSTITPSTTTTTVAPPDSKIESTTTTTTITSPQQMQDESAREPALTDPAASDPRTEPKSLGDGFSKPYDQQRMDDPRIDTEEENEFVPLSPKELEDEEEY